MKKILYLLVAFAIFSTFFLNSFGTSNADNDALTKTLNPGVYHNNGNTEWQVAYRFHYTRHVNGFSVDQSTNVYFKWTNAVANCSRGEDWCNYLLAYTMVLGVGNHGPFQMQWGTTCIDPTIDAYFTLTTSGTRAYLFRANVTSGRSGADNSGARIGYAYGNIITGRTDQCPFPCPAPSCDGRCGTFRVNCGYGVTSPQVSCGGCGGSYCGTGTDRCDYITPTCNTNNRCVIASRVNNDRANCLNVRGCECTRDTDCSNASLYCGAGSNICDRRQNVCVGGQCTTTLVRENAPICVGEKGCCDINSDCNNVNQYCKNPPYGTCTDYARVAGRVFVDRNANNQWDANTDIGLENMRVQRRNGGATVWTNASEVTTNSNGWYVFGQRNNPSQHDVRIIQAQYDTTCEYQPTVRPNGFVWQNVTATPTLGNVHFMFRPRNYNIQGHVYRDANNNGTLETGIDVPVNNANVRIRTLWNASRNPTGNSSGLNSNGFFQIGGHSHNKTYAAQLLAGSLPLGWRILSTNPVNNLTINCAHYGGVNFLVTNAPPPPGYEPRPDLVVNSVTIPDGLVNTSTTGTIEISNDGDAGTGIGFNLSINRGDGTTTTIGSGGALPANAQRTLSFTITRPGTAGTYTAIARVDSGNAITESDETNNTNTGQYDAGTGGGGGGGGVIISGDPDLVIDSFTVFDGDVDASTNANLVIRNVGNEPTGSGFVVSIDNGTGNIRTANVPALAAGASTPVNITLVVPGTARQYTADATVDSTNVIAESDETNNQRSTTYNAIYIPPTYEIRGGVFRDSVDALNISDGRKDSSENYTTGTINISGVGSFESGASGITATVLEGTYTVTYDAINDLPTGFEMTYPLGVVPPNPSVQVATGPYGVSCSTGSHIHATCDAAGNVINVNFGIRPIPAEPWFNGIGGDMRSDPPLVNRIPAGAGDYFNERIVNPTGANLPSGVVFGNNLTLSPLTSTTSRISNPSNWLVRNRFAANTINTSYASINNILRKNGVFSSATAISGSITPGSISVPGIYVSNGNINMTGDPYTLNGGNYVFLINGNLNIDNNIYVDVGSTAIFAVSGDIIIANNIAEINGIFSADKRFIVSSRNDGNPDVDLIIQGSIIGNAGRQESGAAFVNDRNLFAANETTPSVQIIYRPDFVLNAPPYIKSSNYSIKEVAPGSQ